MFSRFYLCSMNYKDADIFSRSFSKLLISLRKQNSITQSELSKRSGITRQTISKIECGDRKILIWTFFEIADGLKMTPSQFMRELEIIYEEEYAAINGAPREMDMVREYIRRAEQYSEKMKDKNC